MTTGEAKFDRRGAAFWVGCAAVAAGVLLHLPMFAHDLTMGHHLSGMPMDGGMIGGMALIVLGVAAACFGALPASRRRGVLNSGVHYEASDTTRLGRAHAVTLCVLVVGLVIDTMKPATLGFVLPGIAREYGIARSSAALLPLSALIGTVIGSVVWGTLADLYGRKMSILLSTILFIATSVCGAMPSFGWNLLMCFLMGASAGGMLPVVYTLLAEIMPPRSRSWVLVLVGGTGLAGGYFAASFLAALLEPPFGWRSLWLQGFPTGLLLLALARFIPESPDFLASQGRTDELRHLEQRFGIVAQPVPARPADAAPAGAGIGSAPRGLTSALLLAALAWSLINFGLLLWLPSNLQERGYSAALASGVIAQSAFIALPTVAAAAWLYARWSSRWTLVGSLALTGVALAATLTLTVSDTRLMVAVVALLIVGSNAVIALLLPYAAENYPADVRGRATGLVAGSSKAGGVVVQLLALGGVVPTFGVFALLLIIPIGGAAAMIARFGVETRGRSLRELEAVA